MAEQGSSSVGKWIAGILAAIIAGVAVAVIRDRLLDDQDGNGGSSGGGATATTASEQPTPAEAVAGNWSLVSWQEAPSDVTLGMQPIAGSLVATDDGAVSWTVDIDDLYWDDSGEPQAAVTCEGRISLDSRITSAVTNEADYTSNMLSASDGIAAAFCGGGIGAGDHPYDMTYSPESDAATLEMSNDLGTFTWGR
jgi:hypothetical protein